MKSRLILLSSILLLRCSSPSIVANQSVQQGDAMNNARQYDEAIKHYSKYLEVSPQLGLYRNPKMEAEVCRKLAHAYSTQGKYAEAISVLTKASRLDSASGNKLEWIDDKRQLGMVHSYRKNYRAALKFVKQALTLSDGMENSVKEVRRLSIADTHLSLSQLHLSLGDYKESQSHVNIALSHYEKLPGEFQGVVEALLIIGSLNRDKAELDEAFRNFTRSKNLAVQHGLRTARQDQAIGDVHLLRGNLDEAFRAKVAALKEAEASKIKAQVVAANMQLGDVFQSFQDNANAEMYYRKAMSVQSTMDDGKSFNPSLQMRLGDVQGAFQQYTESGSETGIAMATLRLAEIQSQASQPDSALFYYQKAETYLGKIDHKHGLVKVKLEMARLETGQKNYVAAKRHLAECAKLPVQPDQRWQLLLRKGILHEHTGQKDSARQCYEMAVNEIEAARSTIAADELRTLYSNNKMEAYERLILLLLSDANPATKRRSAELAFDYNEKARARTFLDILGNRKIKSKDAADDVLLEREQLLRLRINKLAKEINDGNQTISSSAAHDLRLAQEEHQLVTQQIKLSSAAYQSVINVQPPTLAEIQKQLDNETAVVEFWVGNDKLVVWAITRDQLVSNVTDFSKRNLKREIIGTRNYIANRMTNETTGMLSKLYALLLRPVEKVVQNRKKVVVVPHGPLHFLPFHALMQNKNYWIETAAISYAPSSATLLYISNKRNVKAQRFLAAALGDSAIGNFPGLPATRIEVHQLGQLYASSDLIVGPQFTETVLKRNASQYEYLHIATHGVFNKFQPLYSYLLMKDSGEDDGRFTVNEILDLSLNSKMVTLSACETALGEIAEGDELTGMSRAFLFAGSPIVIVSLWKVDDATTSWLMTRFHQYLQVGRNAGEALALAQRDFINQNFNNNAGLKTVALDPDVSNAMSAAKGSSRSPYYWAPFVLIGKP